MELKYLYTVKKIIETGSYQSAAAALNYAQSTITFQVRQLENELSVKLFEKNGGRMELTHAGRELMPAIDRVITSAEELLSCSGGRGLRGSLTVALPESLITYKMQPVLKAFKENAPEVRLSLQVMNCYAIYERILNGETDIAIHYDAGKYPPSFVAGELGSYPLALVASPEADEAELDFITPNQKKRICHIQNDPNALYLKLFHQYLRKKNIVLEAELEVWSIEAIKLSVMSNLGVAILPRFTVENELSLGLLREVSTGMAESRITALFAYSRGKWRSSAMELFLRLLPEFYEKW